MSDIHDAILTDLRRGAGEGARVFLTGRNRTAVDEVSKDIMRKAARRKRHRSTPLTRWP
jgi:hypothetical protein